MTLTRKKNKTNKKIKTRKQRGGSGTERLERERKEDAERLEQIERERLEQERLEQELTNKILKNIKEINNANYNIKEYKKRFIEDKSKKKIPEEKLRPEDKTRLNNKIKSETDKIKKLRDENKNMSLNISPDKLLSEQLYVDEQQNIIEEENEKIENEKIEDEKRKKQLDDMNKNLELEKKKPPIK